MVHYSSNINICRIVAYMVDSRSIYILKIIIMKLTMCRHICGECPFRKDSAPGWLGPHTVDEIMNAQQFEQLFSCHRTRDDETTVEAIINGEYPICRGFIASASASCKLFGQNIEYGQALRELQDQITDNDKQSVLTRQTFRQHHGS